MTSMVDTAEDYSTFTTESQTPLNAFNNTEDSSSSSSSSSLSEASQCGWCGQAITDRHVIKIKGSRSSWHSSCFRCCVCQMKLNSEDTCFYRADNIYCKQDFSMQRMEPLSCSKCDRALGPTDWVRKARHRLYHLACFACDSCKRQLSTGEEFALHDDRLLCKIHFVESFSAANDAETDGFTGKLQPQNQQKTKRIRTSFTEEQLRVLHANFRIDSNPDGQDLERIAHQTGLSKRVTQVWFQNSRARQKKHQSSSSSHSTSSSSSSSASSSLLSSIANEQAAYPPVIHTSDYNNQSQQAMYCYHDNIINDHFLFQSSPLICYNKFNDEIKRYEVGSIYDLSNENKTMVDNTHDYEPNTCPYNFDNYKGYDADKCVHPKQGLLVYKESGDDDPPKTLSLDSYSEYLENKENNNYKLQYEDLQKQQCEKQKHNNAINIKTKDTSTSKKDKFSKRTSPKNEDRTAKEDEHSVEMKG